MHKETLLVKLAHLGFYVAKRQHKTAAMPEFCCQRARKEFDQVVNTGISGSLYEYQGELGSFVRHGRVDSWPALGCCVSTTQQINCSPLER